jgi:DNA polymerase III delta prime subunit
MTEAAKAARREYKKQWAKANKDKVKAQQERYWSRLAERIESGEDIKDIVHREEERKDGERAV